MKIGKFYINKNTRSIVVCTGLHKNGENFSGVVIETTKGSHYLGFTYDSWNRNNFEECILNPNLESNGSYNIPDGCKVTIKDNKVIVEDNIEYYRSYFQSTSIEEYTRIKRGEMIQVRVYSDDDIDVLFREISYFNRNDLGEHISEDVFMEKYNKALNKIIL